MISRRTLLALLPAPLLAKLGWAKPTADDTYEIPGPGPHDGGWEGVETGEVVAYYHDHQGRSVWCRVREDGTWEKMSEEATPVRVRRSAFTVYDPEGLLQPTGSGIGSGPGAPKK